MKGNNVLPKFDSRYDIMKSSVKGLEREDTSNIKWGGITMKQHINPRMNFDDESL